MMFLIKILGWILCIVMLVILALLVLLRFAKAVPTRYETKTTTAGLVESSFIRPGLLPVRHFSFRNDSPTIRLWLPESQAEALPIVVMANGTGVKPGKYAASFRHLASYGYAIVGCDDPSMGDGATISRLIDWLEQESQNPRSPVYDRLDLSRVGVCGHSQGGAGALCAIEKDKRIQTAVALSPTHEAMAGALGWTYDTTRINRPVLLLAGCVGDFETQAVLPLAAMKTMYSRLQGTKVMARRKDADHGQMLYRCDGYVTAWLEWQLKGKPYEEVFSLKGEWARNPLYENFDAFHSPV